MKAVVYCRISQDRTGEKAGVERQERDCRQLADQHGWTVEHVYVDNDVSAYSSKVRPEYQAMLKLLRTGQIDGLIAWHSDRLYRSIPDLSELIECCDAHDVEIATVKAGKIDLTTPSGRFQALMFAGMARYEVERMGERLKAAKDQQAADGKFRGGPRPFGYEADGVTVREDEANRLRAAAQHVLAGGSMMSVVKRWNSEGYATARGAKWTVTALRKVLTRGRNAALVERKDGTVVGPAQWPPIFDQDTLNAIRAIISDPSRRTATSYERKHQGAGIYRCGRCGGPLRTNRGSTSGGERNYICVTHHHLTQRKDTLDKLVSTIVIERLSRPDAVGVFTSEDNVDVAALESERVGLQARKDELARLFADGAIDSSQLRSGSQGLDSQMATLSEKLAAARSSSPVTDLVLSDDVHEKWDSLPADTRGKIIDALMVVTVNPAGRGFKGHVGERVTIDWR